MNLNPFKDLIRERSGLNFNEARIATLENGIRARMSEKGIALHAGYLNCLLYDQDEFSNLLNLLTINETYFFREPHHLNILTERLIPEMLTGRKEGAKIKILSAGCSTGEEPCSLLISLMERYGAGIMNSVSVTGFDIDSNVIRKAREGIFTAYSFRDVSQQLMKKYFEPAGNNRHKIKDFVREGVKFIKLNLLNDDFPDELKGVDVIFFRNVSIYFNPETQKNILKKLSELLNEKGYLFVGSTETLSHDTGVLSLIEMDGVFLFQKIKDRRQNTEDRRQKENHSPIHRFMVRQAHHGTVRHDTAHRDNVTLSRLKGRRFTDSPDVQTLFNKAISLAVEKKYDDALNLIDKLVEKDQFFIKTYTLKAGILINLNRLEDAKRICLKGIEIDRWCLEGHLLLGLIAKMQNDQEAAFKQFKEAVYIQPSCWLAHFYLAEIYNSSGELKNACREYEITIKQLAKGEIENHGLTFFPLSFSAEQIAHLCKHNIEEFRRQNSEVRSKESKRSAGII